MLFFKIQLLNTAVLLWKVYQYFKNALILEVYLHVYMCVYMFLLSVVQLCLCLWSKIYLLIIWWFNKKRGTNVIHKITKVLVIILSFTTSISVCLKSADNLWNQNQKTHQLLVREQWRRPDRKCSVTGHTPLWPRRPPTPSAPSLTCKEEARHVSKLYHIHNQ